MSHANELTIKGTRNGLVINLPDDGELDELLQQLQLRLQSTASFFRGGRVALQVGWRTIGTPDIERIGTLLSDQGVTLWSIVGEAESTQRAARDLGLEVDMSEPLPKQALRPGEVPRDTPSPAKACSALFVQRTLRSGQQLEHGGHVVVIGDVNPGAEIVAGGHVIVWGKLRGTVHAGAGGDQTAVVCALSLAPTQLRIGSLIARSPEGRATPSRAPEMASVQNGEIVAEPWLGA